MARILSASFQLIGLSINGACVLYLLDLFLAGGLFPSLCACRQLLAWVTILGFPILNYYLLYVWLNFRLARPLQLRSWLGAVLPLLNVLRVLTSAVRHGPLYRTPLFLTTANLFLLPVIPLASGRPLFRLSVPTPEESAATLLLVFLQTIAFSWLVGLSSRRISEWRLSS